MNRIPGTGHFYTAIQTLGRFSGPTSIPRMLAVCLSDADSPSYHWHAAERYDTPHLVFQLTLSGRGVFERKGVKKNLPPGKAFLCESDDPALSYYYPADTTTPWRFFFVTFSGQAATCMARDLVEQTGGVFNFSPDHPLIGKYLSYLTKEWSSTALSATESWRLVMELFYALMQSLDNGMERKTEHVLIRRAHAIILGEKSGPLTVSDLAARLRVSREYLTRTFTKETGEAPYQFIMRIRMLKASSLLKNNNLSVKEIAGETRFTSTKSFCRAFKQFTGKSPTEFRENGILTTFPLTPASVGGSAGKTGRTNITNRP